MNDSGTGGGSRSRGATASSPTQIVIVHDELDLPTAALQGEVGRRPRRAQRPALDRRRTCTPTRSSACRIGVDKPVSKERGADHVLRRFSKRERTEIDVTLEQAADAVECIVTDGVDAAMNRFN